ncbi:hypothetical protein QFC19_000140 [Naganishia cerealis]|uniref:Uncharacterized protein n=1 Tax=Naganishia cerealis TaxID=610337 RepID=A0ACC2WRK9_9TREE|nr:hypothetical protein QFC19_000140 [Naganishia cerealis]
MESQSRVRSRMSRHNRSAMRRSLTDSEQSIDPEEDVSDTSFTVLLEKEDESSDHRHGIAAWHILEETTKAIHNMDILSSAGNSTQLDPDVISAIRNDLSYHTMAYAFLSAAAALYLFYVILDYPRLLARLFSSPIRRKKIEQVLSDEKSDSARSKGTRTMGGDFWSGWVLKAGSSDYRQVAITAPLAELRNSVVSSTNSTLNEKQEFFTKAETLRPMGAVHPRLLPPHHPGKNSRSDDILFSYYGSSDSPQEVPALSYHQSSNVVRAEHVIEMEYEMDSVLRRQAVPQSRCLTGNAQEVTQKGSIDSSSSDHSLSSLASKNYDDDAKFDPFVSTLHMHQVDAEKAVKPSRHQAYAPPPHIVPLTAYTPRLQRLLLWTPLPGFLPHVTLASVVLVSLYLFLVIFATFFRSSIVFDWMGPDTMRGGMVGMMQIPVIFGLGGRNSVFRFLLFGRHTNAALRIHKLAGRLCFLCSALHVGLWMRTWIMAGTLAQASSSAHIIWGYIAIGALILISITSLPFIRKTRLALANLQVAPGTDSTIVSVTGIKDGWRAGQYIIVRIPKMGGLRGTEGHAFTIASAPGAQGLKLIIKNAGNWSKRLRDMSLENDTAGSGLEARVFVEGPYGGPGNMIFQSFSAVLLVAGGSGITHSLGIAHDLVRKASMPPYNVRARTIDIVWATKTQESVQGLLPIFHELVAYGRRAEKESPYGTTLKFHIYVTRQSANFPMRLGSIVPAGEKAFPDGIGNEQPSNTSHHQGLSTSGIRIISGSRPNLGATLNEIIDSMVASDSAAAKGTQTRRRPQGIAVGVCGPDALVVDMRETVRGILQSKGSRAGEIELLEESFSH